MSSPVAADIFREALSRFASGVTVVSVATDGRFHGMTASSFASVSLDPPRILVCLDKTSRTRELLQETTTFAVNVLSSEQEVLSRTFAGSGEKDFGKFAHTVGENGAPLLDGALAWIECTCSRAIDGGDHDVILGDVTRCEVRGGDPLIYFARSYRALRESE